MTCHITNQIADLANEPEQTVANDLLMMLIETDCAYICGELYTLDELLNSISQRDMKEAVLNSITGERVAIKELFINEIKRIIG